MSHATSRKTTAPLDAPSVDFLRQLIATTGVVALASAIGVHRTSIERAAAGSPVLRGTAALIAAGLAGLAQNGGMEESSRGQHKQA